MTRNQLVNISIEKKYPGSFLKMKAMQKIPLYLRGEDTLKSHIEMLISYAQSSPVEHGCYFVREIIQPGSSLKSGAWESLREALKGAIAA